MNELTENQQADNIERIPGWCAMCRSRCGCISIVENGHFRAVEPDPTHPTGHALCAKGQAGPEQVYSPDRLLYPMRRTQPKGAIDPGWKRISWTEALDETAAALRRFAEEDGPHSVAFAITTPSGTSMSDSIQWVERLMRAYGSPNNCYGTEICNWHKDIATQFTFGTSIGNLDFERTECILLWGHNPGASWLAQGRRVARARARGARLVVIDPRRAGAANKADQWLRVRPGTDGALALALAHVLITRGWFDAQRLGEHSNGPLLVHPSSDRLMTEADLHADGDTDKRLAWSRTTQAVVVIDTKAPMPEGLALSGERTLPTPVGSLKCTTAFDHYAALCERFSPEVASLITDVPPAQIEATADLLWSSRPVSYYAWSGVGQHTNATQTARAIGLLYALLGSEGTAGGNVSFAKAPVADVSGLDLVKPQTQSLTLGLTERPLGPPVDGWVSAEHLYRAITQRIPYQVRGLVGFGANLLVGHADAPTGDDALRQLEFYVHADIFLNPTAHYADIVLPVSTPWEREVVRAGFELDERANGLIQRRAPVIAPRGESRDDAAIAFALAERLGLAEAFWDGDVDAGWNAMLAPCGTSIEELRAGNGRVQIDLPVTSTKPEPTARAGAFTELWSEALSHIGQSPLPNYVPPAVGPENRPDLLREYPLILTSAKPHQFCHGQHRNLPRLRRLLRDPRVEIHPQTAAARGIGNGDWVHIRTSHGKVRARARFNKSLSEDVVVGQHGWWQACTELDAPAYPVTGTESANFNALIGNQDADPISGSTPNRSYLCDVEPLRV